MNAIERRAWKGQVFAIEAKLTEMMDDIESVVEGLEEGDIGELALLLRLASAFKQVGETLTESIVEGVTK